MLRKKPQASASLNQQDYDDDTSQMLTNSNSSLDGMMPALKPIKPRPANHVTKPPAQSRTLMRGAVNKPDKRPKLIEGVSTFMPALSRSDPIETPNMVGRVDPHLLKRAKTIRLSNRISRFGGYIKDAPENANPSPPIAAQQNHSAKALEIARPAGASLLERAIENANSHEQPKLSKKEVKQNLKGSKKRKSHAATYAITGMMALAVAAYAIYANLPTVMTKVASVRAGFSASLPGYRPSGYSLASVGYAHGVVSFNFTSNVDSGKFSLTERSSNWDSATLVSSVIVPTDGSNYHQLSIDGQSVYLYGNDQAAWVSNGVWYQADGQGNLSTNQLISLATTP